VKLLDESFEIVNASVPSALAISVAALQRKARQRAAGCNTPKHGMTYAIDKAADQSYQANSGGRQRKRSS
jgi:hypothetical protein